MAKQAVLNVIDSHALQARFDWAVFALTDKFPPTTEELSKDVQAIAHQSRETSDIEDHTNYSER
jgi:hypothetical protein